MTVGGERIPKDAVAPKPVKVTSSFGTTTVPREEVADTPEAATIIPEEKINETQEEKNLLEGKAPEEVEKKVFKGFAEGRSK